MKRKILQLKLSMRRRDVFKSEALRSQSYAPAFTSLLLVLCILANPSAIAQSARGGGRISSTGGKITDVSKRATQECTESTAISVEGTTVEVRFPRGFSTQAEIILRMLGDSVKATHEILQPLHVRGVRYYLLPSAGEMTDYTYELPATEGWYQTLQVVSREDSKNFDCHSSPSALCQEIFLTTPHELTHELVDHLLGKAATRWFDEGLAEYVAWGVAQDRAPALRKNSLFMPEVCLHCPEIRQKLKSWKGEDSLSGLKKKVSNTQTAWEIGSLYRASFQLVRLVVERARANGIADPVQKLLRAMMEFRARRKRPVDGEELFALIRETLQIDVEQLGVLSADEQRRLIAQAEDDLNKRDDAVLYLNSLQALACIDMDVKRSTLEGLLRIAFDEKGDPLAKHLAATALVIRFEQPELEEALKRLPKIEGGKISVTPAKAKEFLRARSFRSPRV